MYHLPEKADLVGDFIFQDVDCQSLVLKFRHVLLQIIKALLCGKRVSLEYPISDYNASRLF